MTPRPARFRQVLLKVHSRCNLACSYCYVYQFEDQSWRNQPRFMSRKTIEQAAFRIAEHATTHQLSNLDLILHGGEPLLAGVELLDDLVYAARAVLPSHTSLAVSVQTNGVLLKRDFLELFQQHRIRVGVSLDGGPQAHDRHRKFGDGRGSYGQVVQGLELLRQYPDLYSGILATIDLRNDPLETYAELLRFAPPQLDFLLPHGNWDTLPPGRTADPLDTPYADWLVPIFLQWYEAPRKQTGIRLFESLMSLLLGGPSESESVGLGPVDLVTIETDGSIEQGDVLKTAGPGEAATGLHVATHSFDEALAHPGIRSRMGGLSALSTQCQACPLVRVCGGGHYAHRYSQTNRFANPSVYCADLTALIHEMRARLVKDLQACPA